MDQEAWDWRYWLMETMAPYAREKLPLFLSGGVDSGTLLAAALEFGYQPHCFAYKIEGRPSEDFRIARQMATRFGCIFFGLELPADPDWVKASARDVISMLGTSRKTSVQCAIPIRAMARKAIDVGVDRAIVGTGAVVLDDRTVMVKLAEEGEEAAREYRAEKLEDRYLDCGTGRMHEIAKMEGVTLEEPFSDEPLKSHALALDIKELNRGPYGYGQKGIAVRAFPNFWMNRGWYRRNVSLQVASGLRELHDEVLLSDPEVNPAGAKAVSAVYRRMLDEHTQPSLH